jgi:hypothetical protein
MTELCEVNGIARAAGYGGHKLVSKTRKSFKDARSEARLSLAHRNQPLLEAS